jgi:hypothetical protein
LEECIAAGKKRVYAAAIVKAEALIDAILESSPTIVYVALFPGDGSPVFRQRQGVDTGATAESDQYEELIVNPALVELARRRGEIDCGGLRYLVVRYGNFFQLVVPLGRGHLSVCFDEAADPLAHIETIREICTDQGVSVPGR